MKIIITGGAGFIASHIVDAYINDGHDVVIIDNLCTGKRENLNPKAKFYNIDIASPEVDDVFKKEKPDILNHHAAQIDVRKSVADPANDCMVNVVGFLNLMEAARKHGVKKVIFASSGGAIYGEQDYFPADEKHPTNPISPYGVAKLTCEKYLHYYYTQYGIKYVAFRYANVYGPRQNALGEAGVVAVFISKMLQGEQPIINGDGKQTRDYVYVGDVAELNRLAACSLSSSELRTTNYELRTTPVTAPSAPVTCHLSPVTVNVGTSVETDVNLLFNSLCKILGKQLPEVHAPAKPGEQARSAIISKEVDRLFNYRPTVDISTGLMRTVEWFSNNG